MRMHGVIECRTDPLTACRQGRVLCLQPTLIRHAQFTRFAGSSDCNSSEATIVQIKGFLIVTPPN